MTDREKLIEILSVPIHPRIGADPAEVVADYLMDNDVRPVRHAHWTNFGLRCSACKKFAREDTNFCPYCGAKMDEGASDAE